MPTRLELHDPECHENCVLWHTTYLIQAIWHIDGWVVLSRGGWLLRVAQADGAVTPIDPGNIVACNNDQAISNDGTPAYASLHVDALSTLYRVSVA